MSLYDLPEFSLGKESKNFLKKFWNKIHQKATTRIVVAVILLSSVFGFLAGAAVSGFVYYKITVYLKGFALGVSEEQVIEKEKVVGKEYIPQTTQEEKIIEAVQAVSPSVVNIVITKDVPILEQFFADPFEEFFGPSPFEFRVPQFRQKGTEKKEVGGGSGFIVSEHGLIVTNKHVVLDENAEYTVFTNDGKSYPAKVLARDPAQDLAVLKIEQENKIDQGGMLIKKRFKQVALGDSDSLHIGQTVIAIGNALGEFRNTVSAGVISGLGRTISAGDGGRFVETIEDVIQTDAAINKGNSGGPLLNLAGEVIGINTATVIGAQNIGFAIPVNKAKRDIRQVQEAGKIVYPFLGVRYVLVTEKIQEQEQLPVDYGVLVLRGQGDEQAVTPGSAAEKAGIRERDIILELNGEKITPENSLAKMIQRYNPGDKITLKILRGEKETIVPVVLGERSA